MSVVVRIDRFLRNTGTSAAAFGRAVAHDPRLVFDLRRGRQPGQKLVARIESYLAGASA
jgi:hypothetical protein